MRHITNLVRCHVLLTLGVLLAACSGKPIPFTDYLVEQLLQKNIGELAEPRFFELAKLEILNKKEEGDNAEAEVYVTLRFTQDFDTAVAMRKLQPFNIEYKQYKSSFGKFAEGEQQRHHARYEFVRRDGKWLISGSRALSPPEVIAP